MREAAILCAVVGVVACAPTPARTVAPVEPSAPAVEPAGPVPAPVAAVETVEPVALPVAAEVDAGTSTVSEPPPVSDAPAGDRGGPPRVRVAPVTVGPKHSPEVIKRIVRTRMPAIRRCQAAALDAPPVRLRFTIGAGGVVGSAEAWTGAGGEVSSHPAHACVLAEIRALRFPTDMAGLIIEYPL